MRHLNKKYWPYQIDILNTVIAGIFYRRSADEIVHWCRRNLNKEYMHYNVNDIIRFAFTDSESRRAGCL